MPLPFRFPHYLSLGLLTLGLATVAVGQDVHMTQFYASPLTLNPALTGGFDGQLRASINYRDQWRGLLPSPFVTTSASMDFRFPLAYGGRDNGDAASVGVVFLNDKVREYDFSTNQVMVSGGYHKMLDKRTNQILSGGLGVGIGQRNVNYGNLTWQDEFAIRPNGQIGYFDQTREDLPPNNITYFDASVGVNYSYAPRNRPGIFAGAAVHHLNEPNLSFYGREDGGEALPEEPLFRKYTVHVAGQLPLNSTTRLLPRVLAQAQGQSLEALAGSNVRFALDDFGETALHVGSWVRGVRNVSGFGADAVVALLGIEYKGVLLGTSYDIGVSDFSTGNRGRGALEISLAFLGNYENDSLTCPSF